MTSNRTEWQLVSTEDLVEPDGGSINAVSARFRSPRLPGVVVAVTVLTQAGKVAPVAMSLSMLPPTKPLRAAMLREIPLGLLVEQTGDALAARGSIPNPLDLDDRSLSTVSTIAHVFRTTPRPGRRGRTDEDYLGVVTEYVAAMQNPATARAPVAEVARKLHLSPNTIRSLLREARTRKLIKAREQGKAGVELTAKGLRILELAVANKIAGSDKSLTEEERDGID